MSEDNITVKVSGTAVYRAVKQYLNNSTELQQHVADLLAKHLEPSVKNKVDSLMNDIYHDARRKISSEIDRIVREEVQKRVADIVSRGIQNIFEGNNGSTKS